MYIPLSRWNSRGASVLAALIVVAILGVVVAGFNYFQPPSVSSATPSQTMAALAAATTPAADTQQCNNGEVHLVNMTTGSKAAAQDKPIKCWVEQKAANGSTQMVRNPATAADQNCQNSTADKCIVKYCTGANITGGQAQCKEISCQGSTSSCLSNTIKSVTAAASTAQSIVGASSPQAAAQIAQNFQQAGYANGSDYLKDALVGQQAQNTQTQDINNSLLSQGVPAIGSTDTGAVQSNIDAANQQLALNSGTQTDQANLSPGACPGDPTCPGTADRTSTTQAAGACPGDPTCPGTADRTSTIPAAGACPGDPTCPGRTAGQTFTQQPPCTSNCPPAAQQPPAQQPPAQQQQAPAVQQQAPSAQQQSSGSSSGLSSFLGGLMKGMGLSGNSTPAAGNTTPQAPGTCNTQYMCNGNTLYYRNNQCVDQAMQYCQYGCQSGGTSCSTQQQNQYGTGTDGQPCSQTPTQPIASACTTGSWQPVSATGNGCTTGWQCVPTNGTSAPTAQLSCQPQIADVGMSVAISYACGNASTATGGGFTTNGALSGATSTIIATPPAGTNTATYTLSCVNSSSQTTGAQCNVTINKPTIVLVANPSVITSGSTTAIGWITTGMSSCVVSSPTLPDFTAANASYTNVNGVATTSVLTASSTIFALNCQTLGGGTRVATTSVISN